MLRFGVLCLVGLTAFARSFDEESPPQWSSLYSVKGVYHLPLTDIHEPFQGWYDTKNMKQRIDFYGGIASVYVHPPSELRPNGTFRKVFHYTTETELNGLRCVVKSLKSAAKDGPVKTALPDLTGYKFIGTENVLDSEAEKWQLVESRDGIRTEHTMWIQYKGIGEDKQAIPLRFEINEYNLARGTHAKQVYLEYSEYRTEDVDVSAFEVDQEMQCEIEEDDDETIMNPMELFLHLEDEAPVEHHFERFKQKHGRQYGSDAEHGERLDIFRKNLRLINEHNRAGGSFKMAVNYLADRTHEELAGLFGGRQSPVTKYSQSVPFPYTANEIQELKDDLPEQFDWRPYGAVTPVKDQVNCGSCWAFGAVGVMEGALFLHRNRSEPVVRLSEQALIDCSWSYNNNGCYGGSSDGSFKWIKKHGLPTYEAYGGYLAENGLCHIEDMTNTVFIKDWVKVTYGEAALKVAIFKHGPVAVSFDAMQPTLWFYSSGVYYDPKCRKEIHNHIVLVVGFGELDGEKYWLVKNSWDSKWGINGYFLIAIKDNNCGIMNNPYYVEM